MQLLFQLVSLSHVRSLDMARSLLEFCGSPPDWRGFPFLLGSASITWCRTPRDDAILFSTRADQLILPTLSLEESPRALWRRLYRDLKVFQSKYLDFAIVYSLRTDRRLYYYLQFRSKSGDFPFVRTAWSSLVTNLALFKFIFTQLRQAKNNDNI